MAKRNLLVAHGDLDGIVSAVLAIRKFGLRLLDTEVIFVQPFTVDKVVISDEARGVYVVDIAVNNRDPEMTRAFINRIGNRLVAWYDHHEGWTPKITGGNNPAFVIKTGAGSCAGLIGGVNSLVADATAADIRQGKLSPRAQVIEQAMKANMSDDSIRLMAVKWLLGDETVYAVLEAAAKKYVAIQKETEKLAATYYSTHNRKVALVDARQSDHQYDLTQLLLAGQELAPFAVVLTTHPQQGEGLTIATSRRDVNLVKVFSLGSGAPFRVSLQGKRLDDVLIRLGKI